MLGKNQDQTTWMLNKERFDDELSDIYDSMDKAIKDLREEHKKWKKLIKTNKKVK